METIYKGCRGTAVKKLQEILHLQADGVFGVLTEESVKDFQKQNNLKVDGIVGAQTWNLLLQEQDLLKKCSRIINEIIIHCSATQEGKDYTVADITRWHRQRGFSTIGYHFVIYRDGSVHAGRDINTSGAHCVGHNTHSIGICYIGGLASDGKTAKDTRTDAQKKALVTLLGKLRKAFTFAKIRGHRDFTQKDCPCFDATKEYKNM